MIMMTKFEAKEYDSTAVQCFKNITGYTQVRKSGKETVPHAFKLIGNAHAAGDKIRTEVFLQLVKQTTQCSNQVRAFCLFSPSLPSPVSLLLRHITLRSPFLSLVSPPLL